MMGWTTQLFRGIVLAAAGNGLRRPAVPRHQKQRVTFTLSGVSNPKLNPTHPMVVGHDKLPSALVTISPIF